MSKFGLVDTGFVFDVEAERISDLIRSGYPVGMHQAVFAIDYQEKRQERINRWWLRAFRVLRFWRTS